MTGARWAASPTPGAPARSYDRQRRERKDRRIADAGHGVVGAGPRRDRARGPRARGRGRRAAALGSRGRGAGPDRVRVPPAAPRSRLARPRRRPGDRAHLRRRALRPDRGRAAGASPARRAGDLLPAGSRDPGPGGPAAPRGARGNELGNHSTTHAELPTAPDIEATSMLIERATGRRALPLPPAGGDGQRRAGAHGAPARNDHRDLGRRPRRLVVSGSGRAARARARRGGARVDRPDARRRR